MLLDELLRQWPDELGREGSDAVVGLFEQLLEAGLHKLGLGHPGDSIILPLHLVRHLLVLTNHATTIGEALEDELHGVHLTVFRLHVDWDGHLEPLFFLGCHLGRHLLEAFLVGAMLVAPADVLVGRLLEVILNVVEGMLCHVRNAAVGVPPDVAGPHVGLELASEQLDHGRLPRAIGADARSARRERDANRHLLELRLWRTRIGEGDVGHLHDVLALRGDALERARLREGHLELGRLELEVGEELRCLSLGDMSQVALEELELEVIDLQDVRADLVEHLDVVRDNDRGDIGQRGKVVNHPLHIAGVQVVSRLIKKEDICLHEHRTHEGELHAPPTREAADLLGERGGRHARVVFRKTNGEELFASLLVRDAKLLETLVVDHKLKHGNLGEFALNVGLDKHGAQLRRRRETFHLLVCNGAHQRRLARVVLATQAVAVAALELELGLVQEHLVAVGERKLAVA
mmetsp:Transcript_8226/g.9973  ORF Transcript_8226/g.9973 Transcript_8226/m.9973 type:complete len:462 (-) Transcript_8226:1297-2682(-)|eukprot:scaffold101431_cov30-Tisochrysis_lutea.AAC.2